MRLTALPASALLGCALISSPLSAATNVDGLPQNDPATWALKSVCVAASGNLVPADPYGGCPAGTELRKILPGDPLPYNSYEQMGYQISDSMPLLDSSWNPLWMHTFDYAPFNQFNLFSGSDGFDVYARTGSTLSISGTRDGGGYGSTFYGAHCALGGGWVVFPLSNPTTAGQGFYPIAGSYWEHNRQSAPGSCPGGYSTNTLTTWDLDPTHSFGGINGNATKTMQALISVHGYETNDGTTPTANFLANGHLEVFYYTREYGLTRWEVWTPKNQSPTGGNKSECNGSDTGTYRGTPFVIQYCHDWSHAVPLASTTLPNWPLPVANLLQHGHFEGGFSDASGMGLWHRFGRSLAGYSINWSALVSTGGGDAAYGSGMSYLATNCGAGGGSVCGAGGSEAIYQDIPASSLRSGGSVLYGINARSESGTGQLQVALQVVDGSGHVLWQDVAGADLTSDNGDGRSSEAASVYRSSAFVGNRATLPSLTGASFVRFLILPLSPHTFDVVDAFVNPYPTLTHSLQPVP